MPDRADEGKATCIRDIVNRQLIRKGTGSLPVPFQFAMVLQTLILSSIIRVEKI